MLVPRHVLVVEKGGRSGLPSAHLIVAPGLMHHREIACNLEGGPTTLALSVVCTPGGYYSAAASLPGFGVRRGPHGTGQGRLAGFTHQPLTTTAN